MGTEGETEVDDDGRGLDEGGDKQDWPPFESVEYYSSMPIINLSLFMRCKECNIHIFEVHHIYIYIYIYTQYCMLKID